MYIRTFLILLYYIFIMSYIECVLYEVVGGVWLMYYESPRKDRRTRMCVVFPILCVRPQMHVVSVGFKEGVKIKVCFLPSRTDFKSGEPTAESSKVHV